MSKTSPRLNHLSLNQVNTILQAGVGETGMVLFLYDSSGKLLLSIPDGDEVKDGSQTAQVALNPACGAEKMVETVQQAALTTLRMNNSEGASPSHSPVPPSDNCCFTEVIQHQEQVRGVLVGWIERAAVASHIISLCQTIMRLTRQRIEDLMRIQEEMDELSSEIIENYRELDSYYKLSTKLAGLASIERIYQVILEQTLEIVEAGYGCIFKLDKTAGELRMVRSYPEKARSDTLESVQLGEGLIGRIAETGESILIEDAGHPLWSPQEGYPCTPPLMGCALQINNDTLGVIVVAREATDRVFTAGDLKILQAAALQSAFAMMLQRTQAQLIQYQKITALGELVASVAHDLRNPLTSVIGFSEILLHQATDETQRRRLEIIYQEAQRANRIVQNLLIFSQQRPEEKVPLNLNNVIQAAIHLRTEQSKTGIEIITDLDPTLPLVMADFYQLQQVILNLVLNAEQAIQQTGRAGKIEVRTRRVPPHASDTPEQVSIIVADNGPGMPAAVREQIFEPFFTTKKEGKGTGLGLSICMNIIKAHEGDIRVTSKVGEGTCFFILLPVPTAPPSSTGGPEENPLAPPRAGGVPSSRQPIGGKAVLAPTLAHILVVDDEPSIREILQSALEACGYEVDTAFNGMEALRKVQGSSYDLVLTDICMPELDGISLHHQLQLAPNFHAKFIFITGNPNLTQSIDTVPCILKPFQLNEVIQKVREVLQ